MLNLETWREILDTINKNRLRTFITAFNVAWGIFILIILMAFGKGFQQGVEHQFNDDAQNSIWVNPGQTSQPYRGTKPGRNIRFTNEDYYGIQQKIKGVEHITGRYFPGSKTVRYKNKYSSFNLRSVHPGHQYLENTIMVTGRYINDKDLDERRKVAVISTKVQAILFGHEQPLGKYLDIGGIKYKVVGTYRDEGNEGEMRMIYIPITTAQTAYGGGNRVHRLMFTIGNASVQESKRIERDVHEFLATQHRFSPEDRRAVRIFNGWEEFQRFINLFTGIRSFLFIVGIFTLVAGVVGVSNIMLILVKERTREIGVRKAIGATPNAVIGLFLQESLLITLVSGYIGLIAGISFVEFGYLSNLMNLFGFPMDFFIDPSVNIGNAIAATLVLAVAGTLAGYFPARKAAKIKPIEALRDE